MTYTMSASGTVDEVKNTLTLQAEQYAEDMVGHVKDLVHKALDTLIGSTGASVSVSGHTGPDGFTCSINATPHTPSPAQTTPPQDPQPVS